MTQYFRKLGSRIVIEIRETIRFRWVVFSIVSSTLRMRYRRSALGFGWSMVGPMLNYLILGIVITQTAKFSTSDLIAYMLYGSVVFNFMSVGFNQGAQSIVNNENYIKKIYLPKIIFPINIVLMEFTNFLLQMAAVTIILAAFGKINVGLWLFAVPPTLVLLFLFTLGMATLMAVSAVFFRDLIHLVPILMQAAFFLTPVVYPLAQAPEFIARLTRFNPLFYFVESVRSPLYTNSMNLPGLSIAAILAIVLFVTGTSVLKICDNKIVYKL